MKTVQIFFLLCVIFFAAACSDATNPPDIGSIAFTSTHDCDFRLLDSHGRQIARDFYELGKQPIIVRMTNSGLYVVHAESPGQKTIKVPLPYPGGNIEHYIEF